MPLLYFLFQLDQFCTLLLYYLVKTEFKTNQVPITILLKKHFFQFLWNWQFQSEITQLSPKQFLYVQVIISIYTNRLHVCSTSLNHVPRSIWKYYENLFLTQNKQMNFGQNLFKYKYFILERIVDIVCNLQKTGEYVLYIVIIVSTSIVSLVS